jgi:hypothetical protein
VAPAMTPSRIIRLAHRLRPMCSQPCVRIYPLALVIFLAVSLFPWRALVAAQNSSEKSSLLTRDDGVAIVDAISEQRHTTRKREPKPDCSHLVNAIYDQAGFPYPYAKSADLYRGEPSFIRVNAPQSGDLIVWRGHVGVVTDPRAHLFYSSLRSGLETEDYTSPYWRRKGVPRFYRYRITNDGRYLTAHARVTNRTQESDANETRQARQASAPRVVSVNQTSREQISPSANTEDDAIPESPSRNARSNEASTGHQPSNASGLNPTLPANVLLPTGRDKPTIQQVDEAIFRFHQAIVEAIDAEILLRSRSPIVFIKQLQVQRVEIKGKKGYALLSIDSDAALNQGALEKSSRHEEQRWELTRNKTGWTLTPPAATLYIPQPAAVHLFARQLAQATEPSSTTSTARVGTLQQSALAALLNDLLN